MHELVSNIWDRMSRTTAIGRHHIATSIRRGPVLWLMLCGGLLITAIIIGTIAIVTEFRERALSNSTRELENTVRLLSRHFDQQFEDSEIMANDLISQMEVSGITSAEAFRQKMSSPETHRMLQSKISVLSFIGRVTVYDSEGKLINWSGPSPLPTINISGRSYFKTLKSDPNSPPVLSEAVRSYLTRTWTAAIANRLTGANGIFLGVMVRRIDPADSEKFITSITLGETVAISLFHRDGTMLARYPQADALIGTKLKNAPLLQRILAHGGEFAGRVESPVDHQDRLGAATVMTRAPLAIIATNTVTAALADWREQTRFLIAVAMLSAAVVALTLFLIVRLINRQNREAQQRLEDEKHRLDTALNNMTQGLVLYNASARIVTCNRRYIDMYGLSTDIAKPGCHFYDLIQHRKDTGSYSGDVHQFCSEIMRNVAQGKISKTVMDCGDGRTHLIINKPLAQGGWVATIEDITERVKLEQERDRNQTFLREIIDRIPTQITVKDARDRHYLLVNRVAETQFGLPRDRIIGKTAFELFPKQAAEAVTADDDRLLESPEDLFQDEHPWESQALGPRFMTSRRISIRDQSGEARYIINVVEDVTERRRAIEKIAHMAHYDALTDLPNRALFRAQIERELDKTAEGAQFALLYIDIDEFKGINDSLGHHVGDELLKTVANRIKSCIKPTDLIARLGGDEFAVIQTAIAGPSDVLEFVTRIHEAIRHSYQCLGHQLSTDASIGIALAPQDGTDLDQLIKNADLAMYAAKAQGRRTYRFFAPEMHASAKARLLLEQDLRQAMVDGGFDIHYQPLVNLQRNEVAACEALLRWRHPERGMVSPAEFIPIAEDTGLINEIGDWVLRTACAEAVSWPEHIRLAVNVSPIQFKCQTLALKVTGALAASGLAPGRLELEITEAVLIRDDEAALAILHQLRAIGVRIALDDFGTGYSSLSYLKRFPFDKIKIDRSFVGDIAEADGSSAIVQAVVKIAAARDMTTVAEGVETEQQRDLLRGLGCTEMQGYLFSAAKPGAEVRKLLGVSRERTVAVA